MWVSSDDYIHTLLHQKSGPLFLEFIWHGFVFGAPVCYEDNTVADLFGFLDHGSDFIFVKDIQHIIIAVT